MTREEAKKFLPIIQAFAKGKDIEYYDLNFEKWKPAGTPSFTAPFEYRIRPNSEFRPFKNADECWNEMLKHQPFGWVKGSFGEYAVIDFIDTDGTARHGNAIWDFKKSFNSIVFADGTPFGINEGGEE